MYQYTLYMYLFCNKSSPNFRPHFEVHVFQKEYEYLLHLKKIPSDWKFLTAQTWINLLKSMDKPAQVHGTIFTFFIKYQ